MGVTHDNILSQPLSSAASPGASYSRWLPACRLKTRRNEEHPGVKVGEKAPGFTLEDQQGKERSLDELLKQGNVALVFHRSADW